MAEEINNETTQVQDNTQVQNNTQTPNNNQTNNSDKQTNQSPKAKVEVVEKVEKSDGPISLADKIAQIKKSGTTAQKMLVSNIETYIENMAPNKPINPDDGDKNQYMLWKTIYNLAHYAPAEEFRDLWNLLLLFFQHHKQGVFHDRYLFRFSEYWSNSLEELNGFQRILNLINLTYDPATRQQGLRQVNLDKTLSEGFSDEARQRILSFYRI